MPDFLNFMYDTNLYIREVEHTPSSFTNLRTTAGYIIVKCRKSKEESFKKKPRGDLPYSRNAQ